MEELLNQISTLKKQKISNKEQRKAYTKKFEEYITAYLKRNPNTSKAKLIRNLHHEIYDQFIDQRGLFDYRNKDDKKDIDKGEYQKFQKSLKYAVLDFYILSNNGGNTAQFFEDKFTSKKFLPHDLEYLLQKYSGKPQLHLSENIFVAEILLPLSNHLLAKNPKHSIKKTVKQLCSKFIAVHPKDAAKLFEHIPAALTDYGKKRHLLPTVSNPVLENVYRNLKYVKGEILKDQTRKSNLLYYMRFLSFKNKQAILKKLKTKASKHIGYHIDDNDYGKDIENYISSRNSYTANDQKKSIHLTSSIQNTTQKSKEPFSPEQQISFLIKQGYTPLKMNVYASQSGFSKLKLTQKSMIDLLKDNGPILVYLAYLPASDMDPADTDFRAITMTGIYFSSKKKKSVGFIEYIDHSEKSQKNKKQLCYMPYKDFEDTLNQYYLSQDLSVTIVPDDASIFWKSDRFTKDDLVKNRIE